MKSEKQQQEKKGNIEKVSLKTVLRKINSIVATEQKKGTKTFKSLLK